MPSSGRLSLNTITVREKWNLAACIEGCARHGIRGISPWRDVLADMGVAQAARAIRDAGLHVSGLCRGGMFTAGDAVGRRRAIEENLRAIDEAAALAADCLVMVCGGLPPGSRDLAGARSMVRDGLAAIIGHARAAGVTLALEPLHPMTCADRSVVATLGEALDLCDEQEGCGVAVDVYHVWWDPALPAQIARSCLRLAGADIGSRLRPWHARRRRHRHQRHTLARRCGWIQRLHRMRASVSALVGEGAGRGAVRHAGPLHSVMLSEPLSSISWLDHHRSCDLRAKRTRSLLSCG
jgi:Xylose isomerase-like TIM barrel